MARSNYSYEKRNKEIEKKKKKEAKRLRKFEKKKGSIESTDNPSSKDD